MGELATLDGFDWESELRYVDGVGYLFIRALARLLGVADTSIMRGAAISSAKLAKSLAAAGFSGAAISEWSVTGIPSGACVVIARHFAFEARRTTEEAQKFIQITSEQGLNQFAAQVLGVVAEQEQARLMEREAHRPLHNHWTNQLIEQGVTEGWQRGALHNMFLVSVTGMKGSEIKDKFNVPNAVDALDYQQANGLNFRKYTAMNQHKLCGDKGYEEHKATEKQVLELIDQLQNIPVRKTLNAEDEKSQPAVTVSPQEEFKVPEWW